MGKNRVVLDDLRELGAKLRKIDQHIVALLAKRRYIAEQVQERKMFEGNLPILRIEIEEQRLNQIRGWAKESGVDPNFAAAMLYFIISESCRIQINKLQTGSQGDDFNNSNEEAWYNHLKQNLLGFAAEVAQSYDSFYGDSAPFATTSYIKFEERMIKKEIDTLKAIGNLETAIDLGCATGRISFMIAPTFQKTIGYDISPEMIEEANKKLPIFRTRDIGFVATDIETAIPIEDESVSFAVMNLGTASDVRNFRKVLSAIKRVLQKNGRFLLSFYNSGALLYHWFIPWPPSLTAEINLVKHWLEVTFNAKKFQIYARPYSVREVKNIVKAAGLKISTIQTYPTIAPILPKEFFDENEICETTEEIDHRLANLERGAYILVTGRMN